MLCFMNFVYAFCIVMKTSIYCGFLKKKFYLQLASTDSPFIAAVGPTHLLTSVYSTVLSPLFQQQSPATVHMHCGLTPSLHNHPTSTQSIHCPLEMASLAHSHCKSLQH
jgi:hypothetical protein